MTKPFRSRRYLDLAEGQSCIRCGADDGTVVAAHYCGQFQHRLGKGMGQKCADVVSAHLCGKCHADFDQYRMGSSDARDAEFLALCWDTLLRNIRNGSVVL